MAEARTNRFRVGEQLYLVDADGVSAVVVYKTTGQVPYPALVGVERADGQFLIMHPMSLSRDRAVMVAIFAVFEALVAAAKGPGSGSAVWLSVRRQLIEVQLEAAAKHPYQLSPGEHPNVRFAVPVPPIP